jgi:hypothetical protein
MIKFMDRPCGAGKTTELLKSFDKGKRYFCVVPTLSEVDRYLNEACVDFVTPEVRSYRGEDGQKHSTLKIHLQELIEDGENIVTTHALFHEINMREFSLSDYNLCIDEVFDVVKHTPGPSEDGFYRTYVDDGLATVDEDGKVIPTDKWLLEGDECYKFKLLKDAKAGRLYIVPGGKYYVTVVPPGMFTDNRSCLVNTYMAEGSIMAAYLRKFGIAYEVDTDPELEQRMKDRAKQRLSLHHIDLRIRNKNGSSSLGYHNQGRMGSQIKQKIARKLTNLKGRNLKGIPTSDILLTCRKDVWFENPDKADRKTRFATETRLGKAAYAPKNSKGTNEYRHCSHAVHLYDINLNPAVSKFLGMTEEEQNAWRTSELVQWIYRTSIREQVGGEVEVYFASHTMKELVEDWVNDTDPELLEAA